MNVERFNRTIEAFDKANAQDPNQETYEGKPYPKELIYGKRMSEYLLSFAPAASEALQLAVRSQHIRRWEMPRNSFPQGRKGYLQWREKLKMYHASVAGDIMDKIGYPEEDIKRVKQLLLKRGLKTDSEVQTLEDVACAVFLRYYFEDFAKDYEPEKIKDILEKTLRKMSEAGIDFAKNLPNASAFLKYLK